MGTATKANPLDLINQMAGKPKTAKSKSSKPGIDDPEIDEAINTFITQKAAAETAETLRDQAKDQIIARVGPMRLALCVANSAVAPSVLVNGKLTLTQTCKYCVVPQERAEDLAAAFGDDFDRFFRQTLGISLKPDSANNPEVLTALIERLGPEFFQEHFAVRRDLVVTDVFHNAYTTKPDVQETAKPFLDDQTIRPYAPSLRIS